MEESNSIAKMQFQESDTKSRKPALGRQQNMFISEDCVERKSAAGDFGDGGNVPHLDQDGIA